MIFSVTVLTDPAVAHDFEQGGHTRHTGAYGPALFVLLGVALVLGIVSLAPKASRGLAAAFGVLLIVLIFSLPVVGFAAALS